MSLRKTLYPLLSIGSIQEDLYRHDCKIVDRDIKNQTKPKLICLDLFNQGIKGNRTEYVFD